MAKGSTNGVIRGKKGNTVFYKIKNSKNKEKQGWREYTANVANPQTDGQIDQRIKLTAANNLYRALKPIIQRGWENHKYGDESRRAFLKRALGSAYVGPYLPKGSSLAVPIEGVPITYGSLTPVVVECSEGKAFLMNVPFPEQFHGFTIGALSTLYINANLALAGDQVTYIFASLTGAGTVSYLTRSFYVDTGNTDSAEDVLGFNVLGEMTGGESVLAVDVSKLGLNTTHFAALVSISRDGESSNLRSYADFVMTTGFRAYFYGTASQVEAAKASYRKKTSSSTNWPLDPGADEYEPTIQSAFTRAGVEFTPVSITRKNVGGQNFEVIVDDGGVQYYIGSRPSAASSEIVYLSGTGSTASVDPSGLTTANSVNVFDANNTAAGLRAWLISKGIDAAVLPV